MKGITGLLAEENAKRNPKRTSATAAALMIGVALVVPHHDLRCVGARIGARRHRPVDEGRLHRDARAGSGSGRSHARSRRSSQETPGVDAGLGHAVRPDQGRDQRQQRARAWTRRSSTPCSTSRSRDGSPAGARRRRHRGAEEDGRRQEPEGRRQTSRCSSRRAAAQTFIVQAIFDQNQVPSVPDYVISTDAFVANYPNVFDAHDLPPDPGWADAAEPRRDREDDEAVSRAASSRTGTSSRPRSPQQIDQFLNLVNALLLFAIFIALFGIANTLGLSIIERTRELGLDARGRHDPAAGAVARAVGGGDHRPARRVPRHRHRCRCSAG